MTIRQREPRTQIALLVLAGALIGLAAWLALRQDSSASENPGPLLSAVVGAVEAEPDNRPGAQTTSPEIEPAAHSAELSVKATESRTVAYTYDDAGRLTRVDYGNGTAIAYTYDAAGNLLRREVQREHQTFLPNISR